MKKINVFILLVMLVLCCTFLVGCKTYVPVPVPAPYCRNPFHDHYKPSPIMLWRERITTDTHTHTVEERFWNPY